MTHPENDANPRPIDFAVARPSPRNEGLRHPDHHPLEAGNLACSGPRDGFAFQACIITRDRVHLILTPPPGTSLEESIQTIRNEAVPEICERLGIPFSSWRGGFPEQTFTHGAAGLDRRGGKSPCNPGKTIVAGMRIWFPDETQPRADCARDSGATLRTICLTAEV